MFSPIPLHLTPFLLRFFGYKKWRYRYNGSWVYAKDIHEVAEQLKDLEEYDEYLL